MVSDDIDTRGKSLWQLITERADDFAEEDGRRVLERGGRDVSRRDLAVTRFTQGQNDGRRRRSDEPRLPGASSQLAEGLRWTSVLPFVPRQQGRNLSQ